MILAVLFCKSFMPGNVHLSNDGPLRQQNYAYARLPSGFAGVWSDLNDIGNSGGSFVLDLKMLSRWLVRPVGYSKFLAPFALCILGMGTLTFIRQLKFSPLAATLAHWRECRTWCFSPRRAGVWYQANRSRHGFFCSWLSWFRTSRKLRRFSLAYGAFAIRVSWIRRLGNG